MNKNKNKFLGIAVLLAAGTVWAGEEEVLDRPSFFASQVQAVSAEVTAIDHDTRVVSVRKEDGEILTFTAPAEARNLGQVDVGDILYAEYEETISIEVLANEGYEPGAAQVDAVERAEEGEMPGVAAMGATVVTATVEEINVEANTFKLKGPDGNVTEYVARNPDNLHRAKVGDLVVVTVTESVAIVVENAGE